MDTTVRLRIATRIHFALLRHYGADVSVGTLMRGGEAAREAMWVCEASEHAELVALARELTGSERAPAESRLTAAPRAHVVPAPAEAPQDAVWARDTSGFGVTEPGGLDADAADAPAPARRWFSAGRWRRLGGSRSAR